MEYKVSYQKYQEGLEQGKFLGVKCKKCDEVTFPPMAVCRSCSGSDVEPTEVSGNGTIQTFTVIRVAPEGKKPPYVVAMVELDEGPYVTGDLVDIIPDEADISLIGKKVKLGSQVIQQDAYPPGDRWILTFQLT